MPRVPAAEPTGRTSGASSFEWTTQIDRDHPLVGRIWAVRERRFVGRGELEVALAHANVVLLGEKHDNPDHHRLQAAMIEAMVHMGRHPIVALEMLDVDEQSKVDEAALGSPGDPDAFFRAVGWDKKGWPPSREYEPIVRAALSNGLSIVAADMREEDARALVHHGLAALSPASAVRLALTTPMPAALAASLRAELADSHCGMLPESMLDAMALAQRGRDAEMARAIRDSDRQTGAVLISGSGHAREDRGVPVELARAGETSVLTVAFAEVVHAEMDPEQYRSVWHADALPFSYVWFTPRASDDDPCERMVRRIPDAR
jgi:uncharacterized iron-regulated protein